MEEIPLHSVQNIKSMEVIDINTGSRLGYIKDFKIDCTSYKILSIIIPNGNISLFSKNNFIEIPWENIKKIGLDIILVDGEDCLNVDSE